MIMRWSFFVLLWGAALYVPHAWHQAKGISPKSFSLQLSPERQNPIDCTAFSQPYSYWAKGSQFYVFLSRDGQFVLKIPRAEKMGESLLSRIFERTWRKPSVIRSLAVAETLASMNALIEAHYGHIDEPMVVELFDRLGRSMHIDLRHVPFALQKRQKLMSEALQEARDSLEVQNILTSYLDLIQLEVVMGTKSADSAFWLNFGYENGRASRIDVGSYIPLGDEFSWRKTTKPVCHYLKDRDMELFHWFENQITQREQ